jgi:cyclophilin family peptidyl-prolyl cis-trans isomerase
MKIKHQIKVGILLLGLLPLIPALAQKKKKKDYLVTLTTDAGTMRMILFDQTPGHKANFIKLAQQKYYDGLLFHRIIESFMIQGGDPNSRQAAPNAALGSGSVGYTIPAEFHPDLFHQKGALAAARDNNPEKASSGNQFYVVQGRKWSDTDLERQMARAARTPTEAQKEVYRTRGGTPHLDGAYTVFGQVIDGLPVIDSLATRPRNQADRPLKDIAMTVSVERMKKKKITKKYGYEYK